MFIRTKTLLATSVALCGLMLWSQESQAGFFADRAAWVASVSGYADVDLSVIPDGTILPAGTPIALPSGKTLSFGDTVERRQVPSSWATWSGGETPAVLYTLDDNSVDGRFSKVEKAFGFEMEPNVFSTFLMTLKLKDGTSLTQSVEGFAGAKFFGWADQAIIGFTATCSSGCGGFAMGRMVEGTAPEPATLAMAGLGLLGMGVARRRRNRNTAV
ncbi:MAG: PEP-CTERM sorting domain-containing protein [Alphaproteobacteria bacterium]